MVAFFAVAGGTSFQARFSNGELQDATAPIEKKLDPVAAKQADVTKVSLDEKSFRFDLNEDAMATEKTAEGIRRFAADLRKLESMIGEKAAAAVS